MSYLKGFKKAGVTDTHTIMRHPNGHEIHIAHKGLDKKMAKQMESLPLRSVQKLAGGGGVQDTRALTPIANYAQGYQRPDTDPPIPQNVGPIPQDTPPDAPGQLSDSPSPFNALGDVMSSPRMQVDGSNIQRQPEATQQSPAPQAPQDPYGLDAQYSAVTGGLGGMKAGIDQEAAAKAMQAQGEHRQLNLASDAMHKAYGAFQQNVADNKTEFDQQYNELATQQVDPNHYWHSMDNRGKVLTTIGLLLGGLGGGIAHTGKNTAMDFINQQIDRDLEAQKLNIGTKKTLLEANLRQYGNYKDAYEASQAGLKQTLSVDLARSAAQAATPMAKALALQMKGKLDMDTADHIQNISMRRAIMGMQQGQAGQQNPEQYLQMLRMADPAMAKEMESRYVPGTGFGSIPVPEKVRGEIVGRQELDQKLSRLEAFAKQNQGNLSPAVVNQGRALAQDAQDAYRRANGQGVFREGEAKFVNSMIDMDPTKFLASFRTMPGYRAVRQGNTTALQTLMRNYGLRQPTVNFTKAK